MAQSITKIDGVMGHSASDFISPRPSLPEAMVPNILQQEIHMRQLSRPGTCIHNVAIKMYVWFPEIYLFIH